MIPAAQAAQGIEFKMPMPGGGGGSFVVSFLA